MDVKSLSIHVRLRPKKDDDIIDWWSREPDRSYLLRKIIREYLNGGTVNRIVTAKKVDERKVLKMETTTTPVPEKQGSDLMSQFDD